MAPSHKLTRRQVLKGTAAVGALGMLGGLDWLGQAWGAQDKVKMGFIFVGPRDDYGYNQAHFEGKSSVAKLDWVKAFDEEKDTFDTKERARVAEYIGKATEHPTTAHSVGSATVYGYRESDIYIVYAGLDRLTDIELEAGESLTAEPVAGDEVWQPRLRGRPRPLPFLFFCHADAPSSGSIG